MKTIPVSTEIVANAPLTGWAMFNAFVVTYSPIISLGLAVLFFGFQMYWRRKEHCAIMRKNAAEEVDHGHEPRK